MQEFISGSYSTHSTQLQDSSPVSGSIMTSPQRYVMTCFGFSLFSVSVARPVRLVVCTSDVCNSASVCTEIACPALLSNSPHHWSSPPALSSPRQTRRPENISSFASPFDVRHQQITTYRTISKQTKNITVYQRAYYQTWNRVTF
jgi:hypothetical protein